MKIISSVLLLLLVACQPDQTVSIDAFTYHFTKNLMTAYHVKSMGKPGELYTRPPRAIVDVINFKSAKSECFTLEYQLPSLSKKEKGVLFLKKGCEENREIVAILSALEDFSYTISKSVVLKFLFQGNNVSIPVPLLNKQRQKKLEVLSSSANKNYYEGVTVSMSKPLSNVASKFNPDESFPEHKAIICHDISDECEEKSPNTCAECENGWYGVIGKCSCQKGLRKYCGEDRCGQKGWPACQRFQLPSDEKQIICIDDSPYGFCQDGLSVYCVGNELVCL